MPSLKRKGAQNEIFTGRELFSRVSPGKIQKKIRQGRMNLLSANFAMNLVIIPSMILPPMTSCLSWTVSPKATTNSPEKTAILSCPPFSISSATTLMKGSRIPATFPWWKRCSGQNGRCIGTSLRKKRWMKSFSEQWNPGTGWFLNWWQEAVSE